MEFDLTDQPEIVQQAFGYAQQGYDLALSWLLSPAAWSQFALLVVAYLAAVFVTRRLKRPLTKLLTPQDGATDMISSARRFLLMGLPWRSTRLDCSISSQSA